MRSKESTLTPATPHTADSRARRVRLVAGLVVLALLAGLSAYAIWFYYSVGARLAPDEEDRELIERALDEPPAKAGSGSEGERNDTYVLLLGNDRRPGQTRARSDTIILARLSEQDGSVTLVSIPRDTRTEVPGHGVTKINHASAYGGVPLAIETVKRFTGLPVHHYVEVDFDGFSTIVDLLGGIEMYVDRPVDYGQGVVVGTGMQHLDGKRALAVVRNRRAYADGDFGRIRNQQAFLSAVARKATSASQIDRLPRILSQSADSIETDLSIGEIVRFTRQYRTALQSDMPGYTVPGSPRTIDGVSYVVPDAQKTADLFEAIKRGENPPD